MLLGLIRQNGGMHAAEHHLFAAFPELMRKVIGAGRVGGHAADADQVALLVDIDRFALLFDKLDAVGSRRQSFDHVQRQLGNHEPVRGLLVRADARRD
jgi:hypothetical protein